MGGAAGANIAVCICGRRRGRGDGYAAVAVSSDANSSRCVAILCMPLPQRAIPRHVLDDDAEAEVAARRRQRARRREGCAVVTTDLAVVSVAAVASMVAGPVGASTANRRGVCNRGGRLQQRGSRRTPYRGACCGYGS